MMKKKKKVSNPKGKIRLYLKSFILYSILFSLILAVWEYHETEQLNVLKQIIQGVFFGTLMSWITVTAQLKSISKQEDDDIENRS